MTSTRFEHVTAAGGEVLQEPQDQFYGVRDGASRDPEGNMLRLHQVLARADRPLDTRARPRHPGCEPG